MGRSTRSPTWQRSLGLPLVVAIAVLALRWEQPPPASAAPEIYASPVHAGCYITRNTRCKIHVEPLTINITTGKKLVRFQLVTTRAGTGAQTIIYDFRPDQSNPVPYSGTTYTPSSVAQDFAASCGQSYTLSLQGQDTGDATMYNLGLTGQFTCPTAHFSLFVPQVRK